MKKYFWGLVAMAVIAIMVRGSWLASGVAEQGIGTNVKFSSSPVQARFFDGGSGIENDWSEWQDLPFPSGQTCQTGSLASKAEIRVRPGTGGVRLAAEAYFGEPLRVTVNENVITIEGIGKAKVAVLGQGDTYACDLVLTKK